MTTKRVLEKDGLYALVVTPKELGLITTLLRRHCVMRLSGDLVTELRLHLGTDVVTKYGSEFYLQGGGVTTSSDETYIELKKELEVFTDS